jgi:formylglycine-generating enzyme required for sulfatase activity
MKTKSIVIYTALFFLTCATAALAQNTISLGVIPGTSKQQIYVFWPTGDTNYVLQKASSANSTNWVTVTGQPQLTGVCLTNTAPMEFFRLYMNTNIPVASQQIPGGTFTMGDTLDGEDDATPTSVSVSSFYMDMNLISYAQWQAVYGWATAHGYGFVNPGAGKGTNYPVETVDWYDTVKWSNARSQQAGLTPVYYTDAAFTHVYTNGEVAPYANWSASGYRLPTEAEWEMASRGGASGLRFPWGDTINNLVNANYYGYPVTLLYDVGAPGYVSFFYTAPVPYTSPVGFYPANGFGLYDMAGNVDEWCWDWYGSTYAGGTNPHGPASGSYRVLRGGDWGHSAQNARCAARQSDDPTFITTDIGFRCVKGL